MSKLGRASEYIVRLEDASSIPSPGSGDAAVGLHEVPWSEIHYGRVENGISTSTIVVANDAAGRTCCPYPLRAWDMLIAIYRNGRLAHRGPLVAWRWNVEIAALELSGFDLFKYTERTFLAASITREFEEATPYTVISTLINDIAGSSYSYYDDDTVLQNDLYGDNMWQNLDPANTSPYPADITTGVLVSRTYPWTQVRRLSEVIAELAEETGMTFTCGPYGAIYDFGRFSDTEPIPSLNEFTATARPQVTVDASDVAGHYLVVSDAGGVGGFQTILNQILAYPRYSRHFFLQDTITVEGRVPLYDLMTDASYPTAASALVPKVTIETVRLDPRFGAGATRTRRQFAGFDDLIPGLIVSWGYDDDCMSTVPVVTVPDYADPELVSDTKLTHLRLVSLDVHVTSGDGLDEVIDANFVPHVIA